MKTIIGMLLAITALVAAALPVLAQEEEPVALTSIPDEQFCALITEDLLTCQGVLAEFAEARILPESFAALVIEETQADDAEPGSSSDAGIGDTQARHDLEITLLKADWNPDLSDSFYKPAKGKKYVSVLVRYEALEDDAAYNIIFWDARDKSGATYDATVLGPVEPDLTVGSMKAGEKVQGWVTYEVPDDIGSLEIIESQVLEDDLVWTIRR